MKNLSTNNRYAAFFAAYNESVRRGNPLSRQDIVYDFTNGKTTSLKELSYGELHELILRLSKQSGTYKPKLKNEQDTKENRMRRKIIAVFYNMQYSAKDAIAWAERQGVRGVKKPFNLYTSGELHVLIEIALKMEREFLIKYRKNV